MADAAGPAETVQASFALPVGRGVLRASARVPTGRTTLTQLLPILQNLENAILARVGEEAASVGTPISCRAGCAACCRQMVPVSLFEAEALMDWMRTLPEARQKELEGRFHSALLKLRDAGVIDKILDPAWILGEGPAVDLAIDYFSAGVACPFLENEMCSIHPMRPLSCREYLVTSPAEHCQDPAANMLHAVDLPLKLTHVLYAFGRAIEQDRRGWIPLVFLMAWGRSGVRPGEAVAGTGEEMLRRIIEVAVEVAEPRDDSDEPSVTDEVESGAEPGAGNGTPRRA